MSESTDAADTVTVAGVLLPTGALAQIRKQIPDSLPKWRNADDTHLDYVLNLLVRHSLSVCAISIDKRAENWSQFWTDARGAHGRVASEHKVSLGYLKAANLIKFMMYGRSVSLAIAHAVRIGAIPSALRSRKGLLEIQESIVIDNEVQGEENIDAFAEMWRSTNSYQPMTNAAGIRRTVATLRLTSEQRERLLHLPDYVAGLVQYERSEANTVARSSMTEEAMGRALSRLKSARLFSEDHAPLTLDYFDIFTNLRR